MSSKIPDGWEFVSSELDWDSAWDFAAQYKQAHEKARDDTFVRVRVVQVTVSRRHAYWILRRVEMRDERQAA